MADAKNMESKEVLEKVKDILGDSSKFKPITVSKEVEPIVDAGNLLLSDLQPIDLKKYK